MKLSVVVRNTSVLLYPAHYGPHVSRNLSFSSVRSVSVGFFYIAHYRTLHIALVFFCLLVFLLLPFMVNKDIYYVLNIDFLPN